MSPCEAIDPAVSALVALGSAFRANPFDFFKENDATCFLYNELKRSFTNRVPVVLAEDIERFEAFKAPDLMTCGRVHIEGRNKKDNCRVDLFVLEDREQLIHPKSKGMIGAFEPPFQIGIEVKVAYGSHSSRFVGIESGSGITEDIVKLACLQPPFAHSYVVVVDFFENRQLLSVKQQVRRLKKVAVFYAGLDRHEINKARRLLKNANQ